MPINVRVDSSMSKIPENIENKTLCIQLLKLTQLIQEKFELKFKVSARFNNSIADKISIILFNGSHGVEHLESCDKENKAPINYLKEYGGEMTKSRGVYPSFFQSDSIVTLDSSLLDKIIENLKYKERLILAN